MLIINEIILDLGHDRDELFGKILKKLHLNPSKYVVPFFEVFEKSIDARDKTRIREVYKLKFLLTNSDGSAVDEQSIVDISKKKGVSLKILDDQNSEQSFLTNYFTEENKRKNSMNMPRPVIVGFGPCGIFAAYVLAKAGLKPIVLERGKKVEDRIIDVENYWTYGELKDDSNVLFGEGGAGTFSDGKLTTGIGDPRKRFVLESLIAAGGGNDLLMLKKPHIGTDVLRIVVRKLRDEICTLGGDIYFGHKFAGINTDESGNLRSVIVEKVPSHLSIVSPREEDRLESGVESTPQNDVASGISKDDVLVKSHNVSEIKTNDLVLAIGHSARDTFRVLYDAGIEMQQKPFSMGIRVEHPQAHIDKNQYGYNFEKIYGKSIEDANLPRAEYKLSYKCEDGRGVYSFCMCPGGVVVSAASESGGLFSNGMSNRARDGEFANSAILTDVRTSDFGSEHPLAGLEFQRKYENQAFLLNKDSRANPYELISETLGDFKQPTSRLASCLPDFASKNIIEAMPFFNKRIKGFGDNGVKIYGPETRSSSPVRILRNEVMESNVHGMYPCGEGAGYAGGIMSAAVDGIKAAELIIEKYRK